MADETLLERLERDALAYFLQHTNPDNGLVADNSNAGAPSSIAAVGLALSAYPIAVQREFLARKDAADRVLRTLRFFANSDQSGQPDATGYKGFYYHFLDMTTGRRVWDCELSTIDTAILIAGALAAGVYFDGDCPEEQEIRSLADTLYQRVEWRWAQNGRATVCHGWKPESGFLSYHWEGYCEAMILYVLGLGSPTQPLSPQSYQAWAGTYQWENLYGHDFLYAGPLFLHQLSHLWIDFRGIQDEFMASNGIDYFENTRRAVLVQQQYAIHNPYEFAGYGAHCWGLTAGPGPGPAKRLVGGVRVHFFDYRARGVPHGPDDGTLAPWAAIASLPFAPEIVFPTLHYLEETYPKMIQECGFLCAFNLSFGEDSGKSAGWISGCHYGLDQGFVLLMIENYRSGFLWSQMRRCSYLRAGLRKAGFHKGWL